MSVVSNSGTPVSAGCTSNPNTVQPRMTPLCPARGEAVDDAEELGARVVTNLAQTELIEDRAVHERAVLLVRRERAEAVTKVVYMLDCLQ